MGDFLRQRFPLYRPWSAKLPAAAFGLILLVSLTAKCVEIPLRITVEEPDATQLSVARGAARVEACLNGEWCFHPIHDRQRLSSSALMQLPPLPTEGWGAIRVPGKWKQVSGNEAADSFGYPRDWTTASRGWYERTFTVPAAMEGKRIKLHFGGVLVYAEVLVNGRSVGRHLGGVTPFDLDITEAVRLDRERGPRTRRVAFGNPNTLAVYVVNEEAVYTRPPKSRYDFAARAPIYYSYSQGSAGIWQDVLLVGLPAIHVDNVFVKTSFRQREITAEIEVCNEGERDRAVTVGAVVEDLQGVPVKDLGRQPVSIAPGHTARVSLESVWADAHLWSPETPSLYRLHTRLLAGATLVDEHYQRFGFREFWIQGRDFYLNGRRLTLFGDWVGLLGCGRDAYLRPEYCHAYVRFLKGMNYLGTRMQAIGTIPAMLDACDELGLPIIATGISDSAAFFDPACAEEAQAHAKADMADWLRRDRNHPCILIWSTENEDAPPLRSQEIVERYQQIDRVFLESDPTRPFLHDGAASTIARSDVDGWAPILCPHYLGGDNSFGERLRQFQQWRDRFSGSPTHNSALGGPSKPLVCGEENVGRNEDPGGLLHRLMGDRIYGGLAERDALWSWYLKRVIGAWRTYGIGGVIAHGNHLAVGNSPITATAAEGQDVASFWGKPVAEFHWADLTTPFAKPKYLLGSNLEFVNPWVPSIPETMPTPLYAATRDAFSPILVTLSRAVEHNYFAGETCAKDVFLINEGPVALKGCTLAWEIRDSEDARIVLSRQRPIDLAQGEIRGERIDLPLPQVERTRTQVLRTTLLGESQRPLSSDEMELTIYPREPTPDLKDGRVILYDVSGREHGTAQVLKDLGVTFELMEDIQQVRQLRSRDILVIGAGAANEQVVANEVLLREHLEDGGRILIFEQPTAERHARSFAFVKAPDHPAFRGLASRYLSLWRTENNNLALGALRNAPTARPVVLADTVDQPVLVECRLGKGILIASMLELTQGCLIGEPEARILTCNLLNYLTAAPTPRLAPVRCLGDDSTSRLLSENLRVEGLKRWDGVEPLPAGGVLVLGEGVGEAELVRSAGRIDGFVQDGGTVLWLGDPKGTRMTWLPEPVEVQAVPAVYLLRKSTDNPLLDGLGHIALLDSPRAANYFVADAIAGLTAGFRVSENGSWHSWYGICDCETSEYHALRRRPYYWTSDVSAVVSLSRGHGRYILASLPAKAHPATVRFLAALLANLNVPSSDSRCFLFLSELAGARAVQHAGARQWRGFFPVDLIPYCNRLFYDEVAGDHAGGWDDSGDNDLRSVPTGDLLLGGLPFHLIDVSHDDPYDDLATRLGHPIRACIVLQGAARPYFPDKVEGIKIGQKARKLFFLHTATWSDAAPGQIVAHYRVRYTDGRTVDIAVENGTHLDDWTRVGRGNLKGATVAWRGSSAEHSQVGLYMMPWPNPYPDREIAAVDFRSEGAAVPILVAITGQK